MTQQDQTAQDQNNLIFLREKIKQIKIAMFKPEKNDMLQLPNNIISTLKVDDEGNVWFFTSQKGNYAQQPETFFAYLEYYQKGGDGRLRINGKASIVTDYDAVDFAVKPSIPGMYGQILLLKVKIMQAEYIVSKPANKITFKERMKTIFSDLFLSQEQRVFDFS